MTHTSEQPGMGFYRVLNVGGDYVAQKCTQEEARGTRGVDHPLYRSHFLVLDGGTCTVIVVFRRMIIESDPNARDAEGLPNCFCVMPEWHDSRGLSESICPTEYYSSMHAAREAAALMVSRIELDSIAATYKNELKKMAAEDDSLSSKRRVLDI